VRAQRIGLTRLIILPGQIGKTSRRACTAWHLPRQPGHRLAV